MTGGQSTAILRSAKPGDIGRIAFIHREAFHAAMPFLTTLHTPEEDLAFFSAVVKSQHVVVAARPVADSDLTGGVAPPDPVADQITGFIAFTPGLLNHLYVLPACQGKGDGSLLLAEAKDWHRSHHATGELDLWTFQRNGKARRFYQFHRFVPVEFTDGQSNEEKEPDIRFRWRFEPTTKP